MPEIKIPTPDEYNTSAILAEFDRLHVVWETDKCPHDEIISLFLRIGAAIGYYATLDKISASLQLPTQYEGLIESFVRAQEELLPIARRSVLLSTFDKLSEDEKSFVRRIQNARNN